MKAFFRVLVLQALQQRLWQPNERDCRREVSQANRPEACLDPLLRQQVRMTSSGLTNR